ncbi:GtrA family protein [Sulfobacillus thermosulfidooxidans]|uniref:GtrA family protein n=1 Tax=Sulfobacillus thermosulfidooxidans TaxID=28034 RepID=UPI0012DCF9FC|nr:GtrA family protein [Sulfobacillus thermosulfidooxidans]
MTQLLGRYPQLLRFFVVGAMNTLVDVSVFGVLIHFWTPGHNGILAALESLFAWGVASLIGYVLHSHITYRQKLPWVGFYAITIMGIVTQMMCVAVGTANMGHFGALWGKLLGITFSAVMTYSGYHVLAMRAVAPARHEISHCEEVKNETGRLGLR